MESPTAVTPDIRHETAETVEMPFSIELGEPFSIDGLPGRQSFSSAAATVGDQTRFLIVGGSGGGLHGFAVPGLPETQTADVLSVVDNNLLVVVEIASKKIWSRRIDELHLPGVDSAALRAINAQSFQDGDSLLIVGGYGHSQGAETPGGMVTFDTLTILEVSRVINAIVSGSDFGDSIQQLRHPLLKVTGGGLQKLGDRYVLAFGQSFDGLYASVDRGHSFRQEYTRQIRTFRIARSPVLTLNSLDSYPHFPGHSIRPDEYPQTDHLRRRDLNVLPAVSPDLTAQVGVYGGVFYPGRFDGHVHPIYFQSVVEQFFLLNGLPYSASVISPGLDQSYSQLLSQYECAALCLCDVSTSDSYTTFFGGISSYWYDRAKNALVKDKLTTDPKTGRLLIDGLPFIKTVSMLHRRPDGSSAGYILPDDLPGLLGTNATLLEEPSLARLPNGIVSVDRVRERKLIGHIFGGIEAFAPYSTNAPQPSRASSKFIPVYFAPNKQSVTPMPPAP